jgi:RHS repeat-associated protein
VNGYLSDSAEVVTDTYVYYAFGKQKTTTGATDNPFRYVGSQGYYYEPDLDLYNLRARDYDPAPGVFLSEDPIRFLADANLYRYVQNNPLAYIDPSGFQQAPEAPKTFTDIVNQDAKRCQVPKWLTG